VNVIVIIAISFTTLHQDPVEESPAYAYKLGTLGLAHRVLLRSKMAKMKSPSNLPLGYQPRE
jgi:hypothetical protein